MKNKQIIFYELNEVPDNVFQRYRKKSNRFNNLLNKFSIYKTKSNDKCTLSPWITWPTVHRGVSYEVHNIKNLGQNLTNQNEKYPPLWMELKNKGYKVGVYGSLHSNQMPKDYREYSFYVPDPFSDHFNCQPKFLEPIQDFQLKLTRGSSRNVERSFVNKLSLKLFLSFFKSGITLRTYLKLIKQLFHERINKARVSRRRISQTIINFDIYLSLLKLSSPDFSSFFTNHVASSMHRYWEAAYPEDYNGKNKQDINWINTYKNEINFSMSVVEHQLQKLLNYADNHGNCEIWVCTSMGQAPVLDYEPINTQLYITDGFKLLKFLGLNPINYEIKPAMMPRWTFKGSKENILILSEMIKNILIDNEFIEQMVDEVTLTIKVECINKTPEIQYKGKNIDLIDIGFNLVKVDDKSGTSAYHIPEGILLIYGKNSARYDTNQIVSTDQIKNLICKSL